MALVNFEGLKGKVIKAKHIYIVDNNHNLKEIKYEKVREWWNHIFSENININSAETISQSDIKEIPSHRFLEFLNSNKRVFQAKAVYFIDSQGNVIEFINEIHKDWVNDYVAEDVFTPDFKPDIPIGVSDNLDITMSNVTSDDMTHIMYPDIPVNTSEDLVCTVNNPLGVEGLDITLIPLIILNIEINASENLAYTVDIPISDSVSITLNPI